jgi:hypothetical protein
MNPHNLRTTRYVGVTLESTQHKLARDRVFGESSLLSERMKEEVSIFAADAARPGSWEDELRAATVRRRGERSTWIIALDTLYHFQPSRQEIFNYAAKDINASIAAFDLLLASNISSSDKLLLWVVARLLQAPFSNFMVEQDYKSQLVQAGYKEEDIIITDITQHVFPGLAAFLEMQERELRSIGVTKFGWFWVVRRLFTWFASGSVVRACIVITRQTQ